MSRASTQRVLDWIAASPLVSERLLQRLARVSSLIIHDGAQVYHDCHRHPSCTVNDTKLSSYTTHTIDRDALFDLVAISVAGVLLVMASVLLFVRHRGVAWQSVVAAFHLVLAAYQVIRIALSLAVYVVVKITKSSVQWTQQRFAQHKHTETLRHQMKLATTYEDWTTLAQQLHTEQPTDNDASALCDLEHMQHDAELLTVAMEENNVRAVTYLLSSLVMRNKHGIDAPQLHLSATSNPNSTAVKAYEATVLEAIEFLSQQPADAFPLDERRAFFKKLKHALGGSALCLSGGGSIAMYHMGVVRALLEADLLPNVISGSSGGAITAAFLACSSTEELLQRVFVNDISVRFMPHGIRWFPPLVEQLRHFAKTGFLVECEDFERTTHFYYGTPMDEDAKVMHYTFQDAFLKTGRHVSIAVSASDVAGAHGPKKLLLNHITTPHVLLWSAVAVSCSLPGIMKGKKLMARDHDGNVVPYDAKGKEWVDGSIQHDLPMEALATYFNVTNFIVSQVNPPVVPFLNDDAAVVEPGMLHTLESVVASDLRHRFQTLAFLGMIPKIYGQQFSAMFTQSFSGHVTLIPEFILAEKLGIQAILNPTVEDMDRYIHGGQQCVWPKLAYINHLSAIEKCLDRCIAAVPLPEVSSRRGSLSSSEGEVMERSSFGKLDSRLKRWLQRVSSMHRPTERRSGYCISHSGHF